jgi:hypothetical protein
MEVVTLQALTLYIVSTSRYFCFQLSSQIVVSYRRLAPNPPMLRAQILIALGSLEAIAVTTLTHMILGCGDVSGGKS